MMDYNKVHTEIKDTFVAKNHDYGNSFEKSLDKFGLVAGVVRIGDKYERLVKLTSLQSQPTTPKPSFGEAKKMKAAAARVDESLSDTLKDMANYCIMAAAWLESKA